MTNTCKVCDKAIPSARLARHPNAVVCAGMCGDEHRRIAVKTRRTRYLRRKASDPAFLLKEKQRHRRRYVKYRTALGKPPAETPITHSRGAIDRTVSKLHEIASAALSGAARAFRGSKAQAELERVQS